MREWRRTTGESSEGAWRKARWRTRASHAVLPAAASGAAAINRFPSALRASGLVRAWDGPARSIDFPPRFALRVLFALGTARRAQSISLRASRFGSCSRLGRPGALNRFPSALRASGLVRAWDGPAPSIDFPPRFALRVLFALGTARRAQSISLRA